MPGDKPIEERVDERLTVRLYERIRNTYPLTVCEGEPDSGVRRRIAQMLGRVGAVGRGVAEGEEVVKTAIDLVSLATGEPAAVVEGKLRSFTAEGDDGAGGGVCKEVPSCRSCEISDLCNSFTRRPSIKELPEGERPRERLLKDGAEILSDSELLGIIIRAGTDRESAVDLAKRLLTTWGDFRSLAVCSVGDLMKVSGIGPAKAAQIKAVFEIARRISSIEFRPGEKFSSSRQIFEHYRGRFQDAREEQFLVVLLDSQYKLIREKVISKGSLNASFVHPREVLAPAIRESAAAMIFIHNHPSGEAEPSREDVELTQRLIKAAELVGIRVIDHIIIAGNGYESLTERGFV